MRARPHLYEILPRLREAGLPYRAIEIEPLEHRPVVRDLLALAHALSHAGDRPAWLALLRAPWCGLTLADLMALAAGGDGITLWEGLLDEERLAKLTADGRSRAARLRSVLAPFVENRRRTNLRAAVESAWLALGGPACVESATDLEDADVFLDYLEAAESGGDLDDFEGFEESLAARYALPDLEAPDTLQVMTIHKAKGLEFDTVIVPGLGIKPRPDDPKLFMWMDTPGTGLVLAPTAGTDADEENTIYDFIRRLDARKAEHESVRLVYVAATRAKRALHLLGSLRRKADGDIAPPGRGALLEKLWPVIGPEMSAQLPQDAARRAAGFAPVVPAAPSPSMPDAATSVGEIAAMKANIDQLQSDVAELRDTVAKLRTELGLER